MDKKTFEYHKIPFQNLTGLVADDNVEAYFAYLHTLLLQDIKDRVDAIYNNQK